MLKNPALNNRKSKEYRSFRRRFRLPYPFFQHLAGLVKERVWFPCPSRDVAGPAELKVLAALQIIGRGTFFDDVCQMSLMGETTVHRVFHTFCKNFAHELYHDYVQLPKGDDKRRVMEHHNKLGLTGAIGSTDVTHVRWDACPASLERSYSGKEGHPTLAYEATVDFSGRLLGTTRGFLERTMTRPSSAMILLSKTFALTGSTQQNFEHRGTQGQFPARRQRLS